MNARRLKTILPGTEKPQTAALSIRVLRNQRRIQTGGGLTGSPSSN